jgi:WhiB family transcriptional regulator, redox-sensing transcriptional regulator
MATIDDTLSWKADQVCSQTDPDLFYPEPGKTGARAAAKAKRLCEGCEAHDTCLEYSITEEERWGIWGGLSERQRRKKVLERKKQEKASALA